MAGVGYLLRLAFAAVGCALDGPAVAVKAIMVATMKLHYYPETDTLYIDLFDRESVDSEEVAPDFVLDFDVDGNVVGIDIDHASKVVDLRTLETLSLPVSR